MQNILILLTGFIVVAFTIVDCEMTSHMDLLFRAKRSFQQKQREFIKDTGISEHLKSFINNHRNNARVKRTQLDKSHMYVIKDGEVVPLTDVNIPEISIITNPPADATASTTLTQPPSQPVQPAQPNPPISPAALAAVANAPKPVPCQGNAASLTHSTGRLAEDFTVLPLVVPLGDENGGGVSRVGGSGGGGGSPHDDLIIDRIMEDVEGLAKIRHGKSGKGGGVEGSSCNVSGPWISTAGGMELTIPEKLSNTTGTVDIKKTVSPVMNNGFLMEGGWSMTCETPFPHSSIVLLVGTRREGKKIATFIGECRVCGGSEVISGDWMIGRSSSDCKDQKASHSMLSDVLRRDNVHQLHDNHLHELDQGHEKI